MLTPDWFCAVIPAPFGAMGIRTELNELRELVYLAENTKFKKPTSPLSKKVAFQIACYFDNPDFQFDLPLAFAGTEHQRNVWQLVATIPLGKTVSYGEIAKQLRSAPRAVGQACGANLFPLIIPCHRVTAARSLGGFAHHKDMAGFHQNVKRWLLVHEGVHDY